MIKLLEKIKNYFIRKETIPPLTNDEKEMIRTKLLKLDGRSYEIFNAELYALLGYKVILTPATNDGGKDIVINKDGEKIFVECKHTDSKSIGRPVGQKLCGAMVADNISKGIIVTINGAHKNCTEYCKKIKGKKVKIDSIKIIDLVDVLESCSVVDANKLLNILSIDRANHSYKKNAQ